MNYIKDLIIDFEKLIEMKNEIKFIQIDRVNISTNIKVDIKNRDPKEIIDEYNSYLVDFKNIKNIEGQLSYSYSSIFYNIIKKMSENFNEYPPSYVKQIIKSESKYSIQYLLSLAKTYQDSSQNKRLEIHQIIKKDLKEFYDRLFNQSTSDLVEYVSFLKIDDPEIEEFYIKNQDLQKLVLYYGYNKKPRSKEIEKKLLNFIDLDIRFLSMCFLYAQRVIGGRWKEFENVLSEQEIKNINILSNNLPEYIINNKVFLNDFNFKVLNYFKTNIDSNDRWGDRNNNNIIFYYFVRIKDFLDPQIINQLEEKILNIKEDLPYYFLIYSRDILKKRWKEHEDKMFNIENYKFNNKIDVYKLESLIEYIKKFKILDVKLSKEFFDEFKNDYKLAYKFIAAIKKPVPQLEPTIAKSYITSFNYATKILKKRFPLGEKKILKSRRADLYRQKFNF